MYVAVTPPLLAVTLLYATYDAMTPRVESHPPVWAPASISEVVDREAGMDTGMILLWLEEGGRGVIVREEAARQSGVTYDLGN